jgi:hypothetical protein
VGPTQPPIQWVPGTLSLGVKRSGRKADHSPPSSAEVKEYTELYLYFPNTSSWRGVQIKHRDNFTFSLEETDPNSLLYNSSGATQLPDNSRKIIKESSHVHLDLYIAEFRVPGHLCSQSAFISKCCCVVGRSHVDLTKGISCM